MKNLKETLLKISEQDFDVVISRGALALHQTQRNQAKADILNAIYLDLKETLEQEGYGVCFTEYGPVIEVLNDNVEEEVFKAEYKNWIALGNKGTMQDFLKKETMLGSGFISIQLDAVMKNLDTNAKVDEANYLHDQEQKLLRKQERENQKRKKIERDAEIRAENARKREEKMAKLQEERN